MDKKDNAVPIDENIIKRVDAAAATWRQGDLALSEDWFIYAADGSCAITEASLGLEPGPQAITINTRGLVVVSQTCDIVRSCKDRHYVDVSPLISVPATAIMEQIRKGHFPRYGYLPEAASRDLAINLDLTMSIEKALLLNWKRTPGWKEDDDQRAFAASLERKRGRFAFPDDFVQLMRKFRKRVCDKHDKATAEGEILRATSEIRVRATPSWNAQEVRILLWFMMEGCPREPAEIQSQIESWLAMIPQSGRFKEINGIATSLDDLTGRDLRESDLLDLDHLSDD